MFNIPLPILVSRIFVLMVAFTIHEFAHAWTADHFGDDTPRSQGRITLNPMAHLDLVGTFMLLVAGFGWARPVMVNAYKLGRRNFMLTALAGPASNFVMAIFAALFIRIGGIAISFPEPGAFFPTVWFLIFQFVQINLLLMLFNLIPLAPLDGEKIMGYFLPPSGQDFLAKIQPYSPIILILLVFMFPQVLGSIIYPPLDFLTFMLIPIP